MILLRPLCWLGLHPFLKQRAWWMNPPVAMYRCRCCGKSFYYGLSDFYP